MDKGKRVMDEKKEDYQLSSTQKTLQKWTKPHFKKALLKDAMSDADFGDFDNQCWCS
jgi:hypothetical protein